MSNPKRRTLSDLAKKNNTTPKGSLNQDSLIPNDGEEVRRESRKAISGQDAGTSRSRTQVYQFGKLRSSQG